MKYFLLEKIKTIDVNMTKIIICKIRTNIKSNLPTYQKRLFTLPTRLPNWKTITNLPDEIVQPINKASELIKAIYQLTKRGCLTYQQDCRTDKRYLPTYQLIKRDCPTNLQDNQTDKRYGPTYQLTKTDCPIYQQDFRHKEITKKDWLTYQNRLSNLPTRLQNWQSYQKRLNNLLTYKTIFFQTANKLSNWQNYQKRLTNLPNYQKKLSNLPTKFPTRFSSQPTIMPNSKKIDQLTKRYFPTYQQNCQTDILTNKDWPTYQLTKGIFPSYQQDFRTDKITKSDWKTYKLTKREPTRLPNWKTDQKRSTNLPTDQKLPNWQLYQKRLFNLLTYLKSYQLKRCY